MYTIPPLLEAREGRESQPNVHCPVKRGGKKRVRVGKEELLGLESVKCLSCSVQMKSAGKICSPTLRGSSCIANSSRSLVP